MRQVTVIIPTYRSAEDGLARVVASLDGQTLRSDEFEVLFVDDGSGDGTADRLRQIARSRPNVRVHEIAHSGWPSRPRNTGVQLAEGEYVVFMDHDDALYPEALAEAYAFAAASNLDILNAKEVGWSTENWSWVDYDADIALQTTKDPGILIPMMPHKLYRRDFLKDRGIRFRDGERVHWEDRLFNVDAFAAADRIGMLSSVPFYKWHPTGRNSSQSYVGDPRHWDLETYWPVMVELFDHFAEVLEPAHLQRMQQMEYVARVLLTWAGPRTLNLGRELTERSRELMRPYLARHAPPSLDVGLPPLAQARSYLLRNDHNELLWTLAEEDNKVWGLTTPAVTDWSADGRLHLSCTTSWRRGGGELALRRVSGRLLRKLDPALLEVLPGGIVDVTDRVQEGTSVFALRELTDIAPFPLPQSRSTVVVGGTDDRATVTTRVDVAIDLSSALLGRPIKDGTWQLACRSDFIGYFHRKALLAPKEAIVRLVNGAVVWVGGDGEGVLTLVKGPAVPQFLATARARAVRPADVTVLRTGLRRHRLVIALPEVGATGRTSVPCTAVLTDEGEEIHRLPGRLVGDGDGTRIEVDLKLLPGHYRLGLDYGGDQVTTKIGLAVDRFRSVNVVVAPRKSG